MVREGLSCHLANHRRENPIPASVIKRRASSKPQPRPTIEDRHRDEATSHWVEHWSHREGATTHPRPLTALPPHDARLGVLRQTQPPVQLGRHKAEMTAYC